MRYSDGTNDKRKSKTFNFKGSSWQLLMSMAAPLYQTEKTSSVRILMLLPFLTFDKHLLEITSFGRINMQKTKANSKCKTS